MTGTGDKTLRVDGFTGAFFDDEIDIDRSIGGYLFICAGDLISWKLGQ